jgi:hypothetical protein
MSCNFFSFQPLSFEKFYFFSAKSETSSYWTAISSKQFIFARFAIIHLVQDMMEDVNLLLIPEFNEIEVKQTLLIRD